MQCKWKKLICILAVVFILTSICVTPAYALPTGFSQRSRAFVAAAISALNITLQSATMSAQSVVEYVTDPINVEYTYVDAWQDRPEIQIYPDYTVIDGRRYTDIWLSNEAAEKFRVDAFDFKTAYSIASNSNGTYAEGVGDFNGIPTFLVNNEYRTQDYSVYMPLSGEASQDYALGDGTAYSRFRRASDTVGYIGYAPTGQGGKELYGFNRGSYGSFYIVGNNYGQGFRLRDPNNPSSTSAAFSDSLFHSDPFDFDWVAGTIPLDEPLPSDTGMMIRVPSDDGQGNNYFDDWLTDNPEFNQGQPVTIDVNLDPNIEAKLDDLLDIIIPIIPIINNNLGEVTFVENHTEPTPPVQDTLLPDTYWSQLENKLDQIRQTIQNLNPDFSQIIQNIQTIPSTIQTIGGNIIQSISNLGDTILQDIEQGPIKVIDKGIDLLKSIFLPILTLLKNALGIWHYVVEWIGNISAPFTWILGIMSSTSGILMSPIYACIAGAIVIAVYRRFGQ